MSEITVSMQDRVEQLKLAMFDLPQYEAPTSHIFHGGMYCRQVFRHAGVTIVGKIHKQEHFYMVVSGTVRITTDEGVQTLDAPFLLCSKPGTRRAVYAVTDALCMTIHRVESNDVETVERELVEDEPDSPIGIGNSIKQELLS